MGIFLENKYSRWYWQIIQRAQQRPNPTGYCERHHILPRSFGGGNGKSNLVGLTAREHYVVHLLLTKMTDGTNRQKMFRALVRLSMHVRTSRKFAWLREYISKNSKGANNHAYGRFWAHHRETGEIVFVSELPNGDWVKGLPYQRGGNKRGAQWINDGKTETMVAKDVAIPDGWLPGRLYRPSKESCRVKAKMRHTPEKDRQHSEKMKGRVPIGKNGEYRRVRPADLAEWEQQGWTRTSPPTPQTRALRVDGVLYSSLGEAARAKGVSAQTAAYRSKSTHSRWSGWTFV